MAISIAAIVEQRLFGPDRDGGPVRESQWSK